MQGSKLLSLPEVEHRLSAVKLALGQYWVSEIEVETFMQDTSVSGTESREDSNAAGL